MQDWSTDFIQSDTTYMVLKSTRRTDEDRLNRVQVRMLATSKIPHVLDLHVSEVDAEAELHYNIGGKKMLSSSLKTERVSLVEYYALLLQIATALEYGMTYMLSPSGFVLQEDYMFMDGPLSAGTVYLTYMPLKEAAEPAPVRERIGRLAARWMAVVEDLRGNGVQRILQMCEQPAFSLQALKELLTALLADSGRPEAGSASTAAQPARRDREDRNSFYSDRSSQSAAATYADRPLDREAGIRNRPFVSALREPQELPDDSRGRAYEEEESGFGRLKGFGRTSGKADKSANAERKGRKKQSHDEEALPDEAISQGGAEEEMPENKNGRLVVPLLSLLGLVVLWRFLYMDSPGKMSLLICAVATPMLLAVAYLGWTGKLKLGKSKTERLQEEEEAEALATAWGNPRGRAQGGLPGEETDIGAGREQENRSNESRFAAVSGEYEYRDEQTSSDRSVPGFLRPAYGGIRESDRAFADAVSEDGGYGQNRLPEAEVRRSSASAGTGMLISGASQPTVMLDDARNRTSSGGESADSRTRYLLERAENGAPSTRIPLPHGSFTIGRSDEVSQHVEESPGVSRAHVEIEWSGEHCLIRDIGSRNGTTLNEESMIPYKAYELHEGDTFKIAGIAYTMRCG
ncbi:hypothetical protein CDO73_00060 [Saccharibacillus sp. O23]|uniref:DUF6382 domain-containing protein n=1 Tax=Saccharibacillus sp. O23 TaxID=2009338 RepID=UPI000B4E46C0|nr:DUF6382 domain-containing protein [Saccharibacillus sp. O23]OWR32949.1 hypothetical protein CDO73_00060 [Saccharibacillus sp. O23]